MSIHRFTAAVLLGALGLAGSAFAQVKTWNFGDITTPGACTGNYSAGSNTNYGNTINCTQQPAGTIVDLKVSAYSSDATGGNYRTAGVNQNGTGSGFGVYNQTEGTGAGSPQHAMDNSTPGVDMLLLNFTSSEVLKQVTIGWSSSTDGDFQVLAWTGAANASLATVQASIVGKTASQLLTGGWSLITSVDGAANINTPDVNYAVNSGNVSSSYWLISAYNSAFGATSGFSTGADAVKVLGVMTNTPPSGGPSVPVPGTLALAGLGLAAAFGARRRSA